MKKYVIIFTIALSLFLITGCDKKKDNSLVKSHSEKEIKEVAKDKNLEVYDNSSVVEGYEYSGRVLNQDGYILTYIVCKNETTAKNLFNYYMSEYKKAKKDNDEENEVKDTSYELTTSSKYYYISIDKNTFVFSEVNIEGKDSIKETLKSINY